MGQRSAPSIHYILGKKDVEKDAKGSVNNNIGLLRSYWPSFAFSLLMAMRLLFA